MAKLDIVRASGALILAAILMGCSSAPTQSTASAAQARAAKQDRSPSWQKYEVTGSRIARRLDKSGKPMSADMVQSTTSQGLSMLPGVTRMPCTAGAGC
jgi:PBP1b-binding outer membrane lipoprotein LpoB